MRREGFRQAFDGFDAERVALYGPEKLRQLMEDARIIRNRLKIEAAPVNARAFLGIRREYGLSLIHISWCSRCGA